MSKLKTFIAILLSILTVIGLIGFTGCYTIKHYLSSEVIKKSIVDTDFNEVISVVYEDNKEILQGIKEIFKMMNVPDDAIEQIVNSSATKNFISGYVSNLVENFLGHENVLITKDDVKSLIKGNMSIIKDNMSDSEKEFINEYENIAYDYIDQHSDEIIGYFNVLNDDVNEIIKNEVKVYNNISLNEVINIINFITSFKFLFIYVLAMLGLLLIIYLLKRKVRWARYYTFIFAMYAFLMIVVEIGLLTVMKSAFMSELEGVATIVNYLINSLSKTLWVFIIIAIIGAIGSYVFYKKKKDLVLK